MMKSYTSLLAVTAISLVGGVSLLQTDFATPFKRDFVDGETQLSFEVSFNDALVIRELSTSLWNAIRYAAFREALPGAVPGQDGWLFSSEEYEAPDDYEPIRAANVNKIIGDVTFLNSVGTEVIVVLIPDKSRIYEDKLSRPRPDILTSRYDDTLSDLVAAGVHVIDAVDALKRARQNQPVFLERDTHWTPFGAKAVAVAVASLIIEKVDTRASFGTSITQTTEHNGDLVKFVDSGTWNDALGLGREPVEINVTYKVQSDDLSAGLFGDATPPAVLIGTSYSAISTWNFLGFLQDESQTDILNMSFEGQGPFRPMEKYISENSEGAQFDSLVIWEIPERYLTVNVKVPSQ